jgi:hypothetical protein
MNFIKSIVIILSFVVSFPVQASSYEEQIVNVVKNIQGILVIDKTKSEYQNLLASVNLYPEIKNQNKLTTSKNFHQFVKSLLPYMLKKIKNDDVNGEFENFHRLMSLSQEIEQYVSLSTIEKVSFEICTESLKTEKILRNCSYAMSKYSDKKQELEIQLNRFDGIASENLVEAREISHDYGELRRSISSSIVKD